MVTYEQVDTYMQELGLRYYKGSNEFITNLALKTDKKYAGEVAELLNSRAQGLNSNNQIFYEDSRNIAKTITINMKKQYKIKFQEENYEKKQKN